MTGPETKPLPTVGKQACDQLLKRLLGAICHLTKLCDNVDTARAKQPAPVNDEKDTAQATIDDDFSETEVKPTVQHQLATQYPTQSELSPTDQSPDSRAIDMMQISPVKRRVSRTKTVPQVAPYENVRITRRERLLKNVQNRAQTIPTPDEMPADGPDWYQKSTMVKSPEDFLNNGR
ncbi:hypothetical protein SARC_00466 [Sphaeroforma arctica JP610]|uniref:Uncharacterized protein n=1 Tax=Sphaeroforma arctica JP610 TaxID=667725 RepID=A0A0L0GEX3_9EUKA|nr:hypothetical protein SARC_00466 [Sphaeroforma arctica JP610]KNC87429.1 hypothetical protein SARC_00466 [Sphaeroforma arctica JP610]|eukprot:XP_014161331.1 hypothetical protein SARC_00466 [Sphaeroforma arctica JP610]